MKKIVGINGFGRFGLHLLKYWLDRSEKSSYLIKYINDDFLTIDQSIEIIKNDKNVLFNKYKIKKIAKKICVLKPDGTTYEISITAESGFPTNEVLLISQPWYNNKGLAQVFADAYVATGGSSTFNFVNNYLSFVYSSNNSTENFRTIEVADDQLGFGQLESFEGSDGFYQQNGSEFTFFFAYATAVSSIPEINSGALSQVLLILFALWLVVRRRETSTQAQ